MPIEHCEVLLGRCELVDVDELRQRRTATRGELARATGLSRTTIAAPVADLGARGLVVEQLDGDGPRIRGARDRPAMPLRLDTPAGVAVSVDFGHDHVRVAVANLSSTVLAERFITSTSTTTRTSRSLPPQLRRRPRGPRPGD